MNDNYKTESVSVTVFPRALQREDDAYEIVAGASILQATPRQPLPTAIQAASPYELANYLCDDAQSRGDDLTQLMYRAVRDLKGDTDIELGAPKLLCRAFRKATVEKDNDPTRVLDYCRGTIWLSTPEQIAAVCNYFLPSNNPQVVSYKNQFANPDPQNNLRRLKVVVDLGGHLAEIQVLHSRIEETYKQTRALYGQSRAISDELRSRDLSQIDPATLKACLKKMQHFDHERIRRHANAAAAFGLDDLREERRYYLRTAPVTGAVLPVIAIRGGVADGTLLVPFAAANQYVAVNGDDVPTTQADQKISRNDFIDFAVQQVRDQQRASASNRPSAVVA